MGRPSEERRTIDDWAREYGMVVLDYDGFDGIADPTTPIERQLFTRAEFERGIASCTVVWRRGSSRPRESRAALDDARHTPEASLKAEDAPAASARQHAGQRTQLGPWRRRSLILFTLPTLAEWLVFSLLQQLRVRLRIRWWWSAALLAAALFVTGVVPGTTLLSGPLFVWYEVIRWGIGLFMAALGHAAVSVLGGTAPSWTGTPRFLQEMVWFGTPMPDYFTPARAVTSSAVLGVGIGAFRDLWQRLRTPADEGNAAPSERDGGGSS